MNPDPLFIGVSRAAPPSGSVLALFSPSQEVSASELPSIPGPKVILGGLPCHHWSAAVRERPDTLYVVVGGERVPPHLKGWATLLPPAPVGQLLRHFSRLLALRGRYPDSLPQIDDDSFSWKGRRVQLTPVEATLLQRLFRLEGTTVGRAELARVAGVSGAGGRALDAHVHRLRRKLDIPGVDLATERQRGFRLELS